MKNKNSSKIKLKGKISEPKLLYQTPGGINVFSAILEVKRSSGISDLIPIYIQEYLLIPFENYNNFVEIYGNIQTYRNNSSLDVYVWTQSITGLEEEEYQNEVKIQGYICRMKELRSTPLSQMLILDFFIAVNHNFHNHYIPCISWNQYAEEMSILPKGTLVSVCGRFQSRNYIKTYDDFDSEEKTAYEISVSSFLIQE